MRKRASGPDGTIAAELIHQLTDLTPDQLDALSQGDLWRGQNRADATAVYPTGVFIRALLNTPQPDSAKD